MTTEASRETHRPVLDLPRLTGELDRLHARYMATPPYPHIVLDNFLEPDAVKSAIEEFPPLDPDQWTNYLHTNERKFSHTDPDTWGPTLREILRQLNSPPFVEFVSKLIGVDNLIADPSLEGGGLHQSTTGGFLNVHADFTVHPHQRKWQRRANILLYLNVPSSSPLIRTRSTATPSRCAAPRAWPVDRWPSTTSASRTIRSSVRPSTVLGRVTVPTRS